MQLLGFWKTLARSKHAEASRRSSHRTDAKAKRRFRPECEQLEAIEAPAMLNFVSPAAVYGAATVNGGTSSGVKSLLNSNNGSNNVAYRAAGQSNASVTLANYSGASSYKALDVQTVAHGRSTSAATQAVANSSLGQSSYQYITVRIEPGAGESVGQSVQITLSPAFTSTIGINNRGSASNAYSFYVNGASYLSGNDTSRGTETFRREITLTSKVGSTFQIAFRSVSWVGASNSIGNVAEMKFSLGMSARTTSSGGVVTTAPGKPGKQTWSYAGGSNINLNWNSVSNATNYVVQYWSSSTGSWKTLATYSSSVKSVKITNGLGHYFRVGAANAFGTTFSDYVLAR